ncbi:hypothetical protein [Acidithiobacillus marinus]|uniref:hypothetical protein n=1 Tax=Acidithiobacillus marinus TaxID=187490 RepID=UPI00117B9826|nr:hypothetical protein [Acidithiobacillus marinus]
MDFQHASATSPASFASSHSKAGRSNQAADTKADEESVLHVSWFTLVVFIVVSELTGFVMKLL